MLQLLGVSPGPRVVVSSPSQRLKGTISWNAWTPDVVPPRFGQPASFFTDWTNDKRVAWQGPSSWYLYSTLSPGTINTQAIVDASFLTPAAGILDFLIHVFYPPRSIITNPADQLPENDIHVVYDAHVASAVAGKPKFCLMANGFLAQPADISVGDPAVWPYFDGMVSYFRQEMARPDYARIRLPGAGLVPLLGIFDAGSFFVAGPNTIANFLRFRNELPACCLLSFGGISTTAWTALHCQGGTSYGVLGGSPAGAGQHSWAQQAAEDASIAGQPNFMRVRSINVFRDPRPRQGAGANYSDKPTQAQLQQELAAVSALDFEVVMIGEAGNELDEANGGVYPGVPEAPLNPGGRGPALDAVMWDESPGTKPATYLSKIPSTSLLVAAVGAWPVTSAVAGAWDSAVRTSATPGDSLTVAANADTCGTTANPTIRIYGPNGPTLGTADILLNGGLVATISLFAAVAVQGVQLASVPCALGDTVSIRVNAGTVQCDSMGFLYAP